MKAYFVSGSKDLLNFFSGIEVTDNIKEAKLVVFTDGPAVSPSLYKEKKLSGLTEVKHDINRDRSDKAIYTRLSKDQIAIGIGRGSGFLAVMNGAKLVQYTTKKNRNFSYDVTFRSANSKSYKFAVLSNNYQPIYPCDCNPEEYTVLGVSKDTSDYYCNDKEITRTLRYYGDPELVVFHKKNNPVSICIQFRPDLMPKSYPSKIVAQTISKYADK